MKIEHIVEWEEEHPIIARRVRTSFLGSARKNVPPRLNIHARSAQDGTFLRAEPIRDVLLQDRMFLFPPDDIWVCLHCSNHELLIHQVIEY